jgi:hypothetical protein
MRMIVLLALVVTLAGVSSASAAPVTSIGAARESTAIVSNADFVVQNGQCYSRGRKTSRPVPMEKCGVQRPAGH